MTERYRPEPYLNYSNEKLIEMGEKDAKLEGTDNIAESVKWKCGEDYERKVLKKLNEKHKTQEDKEKAKNKESIICGKSVKSIRNNEN